MVDAADEQAQVEWTAGLVLTTLGIFIFAGLAEIGGGWLVWQTIRNKKPWYYLICGAVALVCYGLIATLQPPEVSFGRVYAVYGGIFIAMSYGWGWAVDGVKPDTGDFVGASLAVVGVLIAWFWPR